MSVDVVVRPTAELPAAVAASARRLMDVAFEGDYDDEDWDHGLGGLHFTVEDGDDVLAHASVVEREIHVDGRPFRAGYVESVATAPARQGEGLGTAVMRAAGEHIRQAYELGVLGTGEHHFYERVGWERWQGPTFVRHPDGPVRSEEDDDGVMVLRTGPSESIDLTSPISCETRSGDDW